MLPSHPKHTAWGLVSSKWHFTQNPAVLVDSDLVDKKSVVLNHGIYFCCNLSCSAKACCKRPLILVLWILTKGQFQGEAVQFSPISFRIGYLGTVICLEFLTLTKYLTAFCHYQRDDQICGFHHSQHTEFMGPLLNQRNPIFHFT